MKIQTEDNHILNNINDYIFFFFFFFLHDKTCLISGESLNIFDFHIDYISRYMASINTLIKKIEAVHKLSNSYQTSSNTKSRFNHPHQYIASKIEVETAHI